MTDQHAHTRMHPPHRRKPLEYCHIIIDGTGTKSPAQYEEGVRFHLKRIHLSCTGRAVFPEFDNGSQHRLKIIPVKGHDYPDTTPEDPGHALAKGEAVENLGILSEGGGSDATIRFTPNMTYRNFVFAGPTCGAQPDEMLFHEMVHATRIMRGTESSLPLNPVYRKLSNGRVVDLKDLNRGEQYQLECYDNVGDFYAILLTNIYASETGRPRDLRADHFEHRHLTADTDAKFLPKWMADINDDRYVLVSLLVRHEPRMANELRMVRAPFNPIRRYFDLQRTLHRDRPGR